jgi:glycosyltransferase involved in cell wall biosynthesis
MEPVGDVDAQSERLVELLANTPLHARIAAAARRSAETRFTTDLVIPKYEAYYRSVQGGTLTASAVSK